MEKGLAFNTHKIINDLPYWFKIKKYPDNSYGADFLNIIGKQLDELDDILTYSYEQTKIEQMDLEFTDIVYKATIPEIINIKEIKYVKSSVDLLAAARDVANFFGINLKGIEHPEIYNNNVFYMDDIKRLIYVKKPFDKNNEYPDGQITIILNDNTEYILPLKLHHIWNYFDEIGLLLNCPRLYGETNKEYKKRLLDVFKNPANSSRNGLLNGIARELNLRKYVTWEDGSKDIELEDPMIILNSITIDGTPIDINEIYLTEFDTVLLKGNEEYKNIQREVSYVYGLELHQLSNENDIKLINELFNVDMTATNLLKYYVEKLRTLSPVLFKDSIWNITYWDTHEESITGKGHIPNLFDSKIQGFTKYSRE